MTTEEILDLDIRNEQNKKKLNNILWKIKPVVRILEKNGYSKTQGAPLELLEQALQGICLHYGYILQQGIQMMLDQQDKRFMYYQVTLVKDGQWLGNVYGITLWEIVTKTLIKIYADVKGAKHEKED